MALQSLIGKFYPVELYPKNEPWKLDASDIDTYLCNFIAEANEELAKKDAPIRLYHLNEIICDTRCFQPREVMSEETIQRYKTAYENNTDILPPIHIAPIKDFSQQDESTTQRDKLFYELFPECRKNYPTPKLYLLDGFHRYKARERMNLWERWIPAICRDEMSFNDARYYAVEQNIRNGLQLSKADAKKALCIYIETKQYDAGLGRVKSYRTIATELGILSRPTIQSLVKKHYPDIHRAIILQHSSKPMKSTETELKSDIERNTSYSAAYKRLEKNLKAVAKRADLLNNDNELRNFESTVFRLLNTARIKRGAAPLCEADYAREF